MNFRILNEGNWDASSNPSAFDDALRFFQRRLVVSKEEALKLGADASYQAFWIGGGLQLEQVGQVFDEIDRAIATGESFDDFQARVAGIFSSEAHAQTVFRNATQQSYSSGRYHQMTDPAVVKERPYWMHDSVLDSGTTTQCRTLDGKVFPVEHPHWRTHWPPGHHRCRRSIRSLTKRAAERRGIETTEPDVTVPEGWGRLPPARTTWKPKGKTKERKKLAVELDEKKAKQDRKKPPKAKPVKKPKTPATPVAPLVARAKEFEQAVLKQNWSRARSIVREQIEFSRPGTTSKDVAWGKKDGALEVKNEQGALGSHGWDGRIKISERTHSDVVKSSRHLAAGTYDDPSTYDVAPMDRVLKFGGLDPLPPLNGLRTLIHEEIHGTTRLLGPNYRGANAVLEEAGVELNARVVLRSISQRYADYVGPIRTSAFGSYDEYVDQITDILQESAPSLSEAKNRIMHFADAFQAGVMTNGAAFETQSQYIDAIVNNLPIPDAERAKVKTRFTLELKATHLPETHRN